MSSDFNEHYADSIMAECTVAIVRASRDPETKTVTVQQWRCVQRPHEHNGGDHRVTSDI